MEHALNNVAAIRKIIALIPGPLPLNFSRRRVYCLEAFILGLYGIGISPIFGSPILCSCSARQLWKATENNPCFLRQNHICQASACFRTAGNLSSIWLSDWSCSVIVLDSFNCIEARHDRNYFQSGSIESVFERINCVVTSTALLSAVSVTRALNASFQTVS